jgi:hypothetical protein
MDDAALKESLYALTGRVYDFAKARSTGPGDWTRQLPVTYAAHGDSIRYVDITKDDNTTVPGRHTCGCNWHVFIVLKDQYRITCPKLMRSQSYLVPYSPIEAEALRRVLKMKLPPSIVSAAMPNGVDIKAKIKPGYRKGHFFQIWLKNNPDYTSPSYRKRHGLTVEEITRIFTDDVGATISRQCAAKYLNTNTVGDAVREWVTSKIGNDTCKEYLSEKKMSVAEFFHGYIISGGLGRIRGFRKQIGMIDDEIIKSRQAVNGSESPPP